MDYSGKIITKNPVEPSQTSAPGVWTLDQATQAVQGNNWPIAYVPNPISRSLRFNSADFAYLSRTPGSPGNKKTFTVSFWIKRSGLSATNAILDGDSSDGNRGEIYFDSSDKLAIYDFYAASGGLQISSARAFRDVGAWMHIVIAFDTTQATDSNRLKIYVNGVQENLASYSVGSGASRYPALDADFSWNGTTTHWIGHCNSGSSAYSNQYLTEFYNVDGQQLDASYFGMTDPRTGAWIPKKYSGTYGTNGFYLNFSDNSTTAALGTDYSGNSNTWTTNGFSVTTGSGNDSLTDVPTPWVAYNSGDVGGVIRGNYATWNPLRPSGATLSNGNLDAVTGNNGSSNTGYLTSTLWMPESGKYYFEVTPTTVGEVAIGLTTNSNNRAAVYYRQGDVYINGSVSFTGSSYTNNDVIGVAVDMDALTIRFYKNNTAQGSGTSSLSGMTGPFVSCVAHLSGTGSSTVTANFGQRPFAYTPPAGFKSLCTTNLPDPTILDGGDYFNVVTWTGTNTTGNRSVSGVGFQPDFVWAKTRSTSYASALYDVIRGAGANTELISSETLAEGGGNNDVYGYLSSFDSDGFSSSTGSSGNNWYFNQLNYTYVAWNWKAGGTGVTNTDGTITSTVSANTTAGFSIATGTTLASGTLSIGHGLGVSPAMVIYKSRDTAGQNWWVWHQSLPNAATGRALQLNTTSGEVNGAYYGTPAVSPTVVTMAAAALNSDGFVLYSFAPIAGFSAFGSYTGNGSTDGSFIYTGFRPRYVLMKSSTQTSPWQVFDTARDPTNVCGYVLLPNSSAAESSFFATVDILSNGFKLRYNGDPNTSGQTYIYAAFAENPFKYSNAR